MAEPRLVYAANRRIGAACLRALLDAGWPPVALVVAAGRSAECSDEIRALLPEVPVFAGKEFREPGGVQALRELEADYLVSVHFPYIIPPEVLDLARIGTLNLHPAYLPYNRGWHTPSWAILDGTPYGGTLHWVDEGLDTGQIALQRRVDVRPNDTANGLYQRVLAAEEELFIEAIPLMRERRLPRLPQPSGGSAHVKADLTAVRRLDLEAVQPVEETLRRLRALTTNSWEEAAYFEVDGRRYAVRVELREEGEGEVGTG
jgi:methionyl-tRNA formyltransferase